MSAGEFIYVVEGVPFLRIFERDASETTVIESETGAMSTNVSPLLNYFPTVTFLKHLAI